MGAEGQSHDPASDKKDKVNHRVVPVILVPGVMGSRIDISGATSDWDPDDAAEMAGWVGVSRRRNVKHLNVATRGTVMQGFEQLAGIPKVSKPVNPTENLMARPRLKEIALDAETKRIDSRAIRSIVSNFWSKRGWGELSWNFYGEFLMQVAEELNPGSHASEVHPVYACGYDWRQSNADSANTLVARINRALSEHPTAKKVAIVTHSMGGLVTRAALLKGMEPKIAGVVHTVIPADGAVMAYRRMHTGARAEFNDGPDAFRSILGKTRLHYTVQQSVLRGPTELLPSETYPDPFIRFGGLTNKDLTNLYGDYARTETPGFMYQLGEVDDSETFDLTVEAADIANLKQRIEDARVFMGSISTRFHANTILMPGIDHMTDQLVNFNKGARTASGENMLPLAPQTRTGDGTVPLASALAKNCTTAIDRIESPVPHGECFQVKTFRPAVIAQLRRVLFL